MFSDGNCDSSLGSLAGLLSGSVGVEELPVLVMPVDSFGFKLREPSFLHNNSLNVLCQCVVQDVAAEVESADVDLPNFGSRIWLYALLG